MISSDDVPQFVRPEQQIVLMTIIYTEKSNEKGRFQETNWI
jgi:hypothetical protein